MNGIIPSPVETAIHRHDPTIFLLVGLGASLDIGIKQSYRGSWAKKASLLEAVEAIVKSIDKEMGRLQQPAEPESMDVDHADQPDWKTWIIESNQAIKNFDKKENNKRQDNKRINELTRMKDYLEEVLELMKEKKAKTWNQIHPDGEKKEKDDSDTDKQEKPESPFFSVWSSEWWATPVLREKASLYEDLYEACWNGDDDKLRELCLPPPEGTTRKVAPIQIVCKTIEGGKPHLILMVPNTLTPLFAEYTPLRVAIHRRHWSTVKTILTIAAAQQKTKPEVTARTTFNTLDINLGPVVSLFPL